MKLIFATMFFVFSFPCWAAANRSDYPLTVHVSRSRVGFICYWAQTPCLGPQLLTATIDGTEYELATGDFKVGGRRIAVLALGDYKARILKDEHKNPYEIIRVYEFLFPDNTTEHFAVVGIGK